MVSPQGITQQNLSRVPGVNSMLGTEAMLETGGFDFLQYLLGLKVSGTESELDANPLLNAMGTQKEEKAQDEALLSLFQDKQEPLWNPLVPTGVQVPTLSQTLQNNATKDLNRGLEGTEMFQGKDATEVKPQASQDSRSVYSNTNEFLQLEGMKEGGFGQLTQQTDINSLTNQNNQKELAFKKYASQEGENQKLEQVKTYTRRLDSAQNANDLQTQTVTTTVTSELRGKNESDQSEVDNDKNRDRQIGDVLVGNVNKSEFKLANTFDAKVENGSSTKTHTLPEVFQKVESMIHHGGGKMTVHLTPPELGKVEIQVTARGKNVELQMKSENDFAKQTIEAHVNDLKNSMAGQDLTLSKVEVQVSRDFDNLARGGQFAAFSGQGQAQSQSHGFSQGTQRESQYRDSSKIAGVTQAKSSSSASPMRSAGGLNRGSVDIRI